LENMANTSYVLDMTRPYDNLLACTGAKAQTFIWGNSLLSASAIANGTNMHQDSTTTPIYYLQDHLGSSIRLLSDNANITNALSYDEFGIQEVYPVQPMQTQQGEPQPTALFDNPFGFTGYQLDEITNLHYAQARYYNPGNARFTAEDPIKDQLNWYGYCNGNPVKSIDPTGLSPVDNLLRRYGDGARTETLEQELNRLANGQINSPGSYDAIQMNVSGNNVTLDIFIQMQGALVDYTACTTLSDIARYPRQAPLTIDGVAVSDLVIQGIEMWGGSFTCIFGFEVNVDVNVHVVGMRQTNQEFITVDIRNTSGSSHVPGAYSRDNWNPSTQSTTVIYLAWLGGDRKEYGEFRNVVAHEFGHLFGIADGNAEWRIGDYPARPFAAMLAIYNIMAYGMHGRHLDDAYVSAIEMQMLLQALATGEWQNFMTYYDRVQSRAARSFGCD